jgi:hypothetical protein
LTFEVELLDFEVDYTSIPLSPEQENALLRESWDFSKPDFGSSPTMLTLSRLIALSTSFAMLIVGLQTFLLSSQFYYFTQIGNHLVWVSSLLQLYLGYHRNSVSNRLFKVTVIFTEYAFTFQIVVTLVYWAALHTYMLERINAI